METNVKHSRTVFSMAVALWWRLLVPLLALDEGTGTIHHAYQRRRLLGPLMSPDINCTGSAKRDQVCIEFSLPSKRFLSARLWIGLLGPLSRLGPSVTRIRLLNRQQLWWPRSVCQTCQKKTWNEDRVGGERKGENLLLSPTSSIGCWGGALTITSPSHSPVPMGLGLERAGFAGWLCELTSTPLPPRLS